jgi:hypothetical protein
MNRSRFTEIFQRKENPPGEKKSTEIVADLEHFYRLISISILNNPGTAINRKFLN